MIRVIIAGLDDRMVTLNLENLVEFVIYVWDVSATGSKECQSLLEIHVCRDMAVPGRMDVIEAPATGLSASSLVREQSSTTEHEDINYTAGEGKRILRRVVGT
jgi:hypothetical protein